MYTSTGRTNARHGSHKDGKTVPIQSPQINTVTDAVAGSSTINDQSCDLVMREMDMDMLENDSSDRFSPISQNGCGGAPADSEYVPESNCEVGFLITVHAVTFRLSVKI